MEALQFIGSLQKCGRVCRGGVSSCASHSLRMLVLLVALFSFGWGNAAYADTYYWYYGLDDGSSTLTVTKSPEALSASDHSFSANGKTINGAVKLYSSGYVKFTTSKTATVTLGISTKKTQETKPSDSYVKFDGVATEKVLNGIDNENNEDNTHYTPKEITISNVGVGEHTITRGGTEMGIYYIKVVETEETETPTTPTATFTYGETSWTSPSQDEMTITVPSHKGGKTFEVTLSNISAGATLNCTQFGTLNGNTLTITAPTSTASAAEQTTTMTLTKGDATTIYKIKVTTEAKTGITFNPNTRYSQLLIDKRTGSFYANTTASGINSTSGTLDYVPGLVAKAMIEAVDYYKDNPAGDITVAEVKGWFDKVQGYGDSHTIKDAGKNGESFDDLNAVKLYFGLKSVAASDKLSGIADNTTGWNEKIKSALGGIKNANTSYVIKSGTGAADMEGGWWHKSKYENQMWCDGQYMGTALLAQMINDDQYKDGTGGNSVTGTKNGDWDLICKQLDITWKYLWNDKTKLIHHAFAADNGSAETSKMWVFDKKTDETNNYRNEACWARAAGWYFLALIDVLEQMDKAKYSGSNYNTIKTHLQTLAAGLKTRQDAETGCWYQLPLYDGTYSATDCGNGATKTRVYNYLESSATAIFAASYLKGIRLGYLDKNTYEETAKKAYKGIIEHFMTSDNNIYWSSRSAGLGLETEGAKLRTGSNAYYLKGFDVVPTKVTDDGTSKDETGTTTLVNGTEGKVLGAMILAAVEYERAYMSNEGNQSGSATFTLDQLNYFAGTAHNTGVETAYTTGDGYITLSSSSENVQAQMTANTGTKVRNPGTFAITSNNGATISKVVLVTSQDNRQLTSTPVVTPTQSGKIYTYTFPDVASAVTFTNNSTSGNIYVTSINVEYEYTSTSEKTQLRGSFANDITGYVGDNGIALPALTVTAGGNALEKETGYTVTYQSSNTSAVTISNEKINLIAAGNAVITATITPVDAQYAATTATFTVTSLPLVDLVVDVPDVTMYTTASEVTQPSVTVYALVNGENVALTAGTHYTVAYTVKTPASPSNVTGGNSITVNGTSGNYTAGNNVITVTVTPTPAGVNAYHCKATTKDFNYNVVTAGQKLKPTVVVSENISYQVSQAKPVTVSVKYDGNDITDLFNFGYELSTTAYGSVSSNANVFTFTPGSTVYSGIILTITATPIDAYADQYYTVEKTCTLNIVDKALAVVAELSATNVNIGENIYFTSVTVKDNEGKILSIDDGECTVEYQSSAPSVLAINASTGVMTPLAEGETTVKVIARKDNEGYASASWTQTVTVIDPTVYKVKSGATAPKNGTVVTDVEGMAMTYGGWMFESGISRTVTNAAGTKTDSEEYFGKKGNTIYKWGDAGSDGAGSLSNFKYSFMGNSHQNPRDEMGANALPEGYYNIGYQGHDNIKPIDPMFNVPVEGAYISFAPKTNGTVIAHVLQEGAFSGSYNSTDANKVVNKLAYRRDRRVLVLNEMGQRLTDVKATLDVTTGKMPKDDKDKKTIITDVTKYKKLDGEYLTKEYDFTKDFVGFTGFNIDNNNEITNFQNGLYKFYGKEGDPDYGKGDGWGVLVKAPVTYEFKVKAGKTYYLYNYGSKINVFGFQFKPDANVVVDNVEYKEQQDNTITSTSEGHVASVSLDRKFVVDKWNAAVLPFSLNKQQVDAIFGTTYDKDHPNGTQILYFEKTQGKYVYYTRHAYNTIVAGKPFLIKPTGKNDDGTNVATLSDDYIVLNTSKIEKFPYVTIEDNLASEWGRGKESADYVWKSDYYVQAIEPNDYYINSAGNLIMREGTNAKVQSFRGFLKKKSNTASAKLFSVAYFDLLSDNADIPSKIEDLMMDSNGNLINVPHDGMIYNLNGQVISTDPASLHSLPKGIYILNGKKYVVE